MPSTNRFAGYVLDGAAYAAWLAMMADFVFYFFLESHSPTQPDAESGRIAEMNSHGFLFYVHPWEKRTFELVLIGGFIAMAALVLLRRRIYGGDSVQEFSLRTFVPLLGVAAALAYLLCQYLLSRIA